MKRLASLLLAALLGIGSASAPSGEGIGFIPCPIGWAVSALVRRYEASQKQVPDPAPGRKKTVADDTGSDFAADPEFEFTAETWVANELTFVSEKAYADPFNDVELDLILAGNGVKYTVPCFWNGGNEWKARFVCPSKGEWRFETVCSDADNAALNARSGRVQCSDYSGPLEIYKHGFVTTAEGKKYFTYDDGTPFFYLGDTHWSLGDETLEMVKTIADTRVSQGFTVWQSEPIGEKFTLFDGVDEGDMAGFAAYDAKFAAIAGAGLVHANAEFFFPSYMQVLIDYEGGCEGEETKAALGGKDYAAGELSQGVKSYLKKLTRYWVARYGAYPVMWTLGQEVDNDFYSENGDHPSWNFINNPYKLVAAFLDEYDPYSHPITAHQENSGSVTAYGTGEGTGEKLKKYSDTLPSAFRDVSAHDWYAAQWSVSLTDRSDYKREKDFWFNSQGKPVINYEGRYCMLWTKNYGSRVQGWASFLNGMYGYGWGAHDTWSYLNIYDEQNDSFDGIDHITSAEKINATWQDALTYPCAYQMGYLKRFFTSVDWWNLIPRFDSRLYFAPRNDVLAFTAGNADNSKLVVYFYSFTDPAIGEKPNAKASHGSRTGTIRSLIPGAQYKYKWFDPLSGEFSSEGSFTASAFGTYKIGDRVWNGEKVNRDMVFYMYQ